MKSYEHDGVDLEDGKTGKSGDKPIQRKIHNRALLSGLAYCISSCSMILVNKFVLSSYNFNAGIFLMLYQNLVSVIIVVTLSLMGLITTEPLTLRLMKVWFPVNVIFVGMLITSMFSLKYINVAMVTVLKNVTNVITAVGEMYLFNKQHDNRVWAALFLMIISAVSGGITDLSFNAVGYAWQIANCFLTASYSLTLRRTMDTAKQVTQSGNLNEFSMVLLNNTLSLPLGLLLSFSFNEMDYLYQTPLLRLPSFWMVMTLSGLLGLAISFTSMWFLHQDTFIHSGDRSFQCTDQFAELSKYTFWSCGWSCICQSQNEGEVLKPLTIPSHFPTSISIGHGKRLLKQSNEFTTSECYSRYVLHVTTEAFATLVVKF